MINSPTYLLVSVWIRSQARITCSNTLKRVAKITQNNLQGYFSLAQTDLCVLSRHAPMESASYSVGTQTLNWREFQKLHAALSAFFFSEEKLQLCSCCFMLCSTDEAWSQTLTFPYEDFWISVNSTSQNMRKEHLRRLSSFLSEATVPCSESHGTLLGKGQGIPKFTSLVCFLLQPQSSVSSAPVSTIVISCILFHFLVAYRAKMISDVLLSDVLLPEGRISPLTVWKIFLVQAICSSR